MLLSIEGIDGVGKTTVINYLKEKFADNSLVVFTREPKYMDEEKKRLILSFKDPIYKLSVFWEDHMKHQVDFIVPNLIFGNTIICDRGIFSRIAYQAVEISNCYGTSIREAINYIEELHRYSYWPDKVFIIWSDEKMLYDRLSLKHDNMDTSDIAKLKKVEEAYLEALMDWKCPYVGLNMADGSEHIAAEIAGKIAMEFES